MYVFSSITHNLVSLCMGISISYFLKQNQIPQNIREWLSKGNSAACRKSHIQADPID